RRPGTRRPRLRPAALPGRRRAQLVRAPEGGHGRPLPPLRPAHPRRLEDPDDPARRPARAGRSGRGVPSSAGAKNPLRRPSRGVIAMPMTARQALEVLAAHRGNRLVVTTMTAVDVWPALSDT